MENTIITIGMFDGVHLGHRHILNLLLEKSSLLSLSPVVITFDKHPRQVIQSQTDYHPNPVELLNTFNERISLLKSNGVPLVEVLPFSRQLAALSACQFYDRYLLPTYRPKAFVFGYDNTFGNRANNDFDLLRARLSDSGVRIFDDVPVLYGDSGISSTRIRRALASGDVAAANEMLGYRYSVSGTVVQGKRLGHTLGFPTANISVADGGKLLPRDGVYVVVASIDNVPFLGVANWGVQPTVAGSNRVLEVFFVDYHGDLYGRQLSVSFVDRLRDICRFDSVDDLSAHIREDVSKSLAYSSVLK